MFFILSQAWNKEQILYSAFFKQTQIHTLTIHASRLATRENSLRL